MNDQNCTINVVNHIGIQSSYIKIKYNKINILNKTNSITHLFLIAYVYTVLKHESSNLPTQMK